MPWCRFYCPPGALKQEEKAAIAKGITDIYAEKYPHSAVLVAFLPFEPNGFFKGGEANDTFFRITLQHMKGSWNVDELENDVRIRWRDTWKPYIDDRGFGYELQIEEIPATEISMNNFLANSFLGDPMLKEFVKSNTVFPLKTVPA